MVLENNQTETTEQETEQTQTGPKLPEAFDKASDAIEAEKTQEQLADTEDVSTDTETVDIEIEDVSETDVSTETELSAEDNEILKNIDEDVLDTLRDYYDENEIIGIAKNKPEFLTDIKDALNEYEADDITQAQKQPEVESEKLTQTETEKLQADYEELKLELDENVVGADNKKAIDALTARLNELGKTISGQKKDLDEQKQKLQSERDAAYNRRIDACFDRHSKELFSEAKKGGLKEPVVDLGKTSFFERKSWKQLTNRQRKQANLRTEIYQHAAVTSELRKIPIEKAIAIEINRFRNQDGDKAAEERVLKKMQQEEQRFTNPPTRRLSSPKNRQFATDADRMDYRMMVAEQEAGLE